MKAKLCKVGKVWIIQWKQPETTPFGFMPGLYTPVVNWQAGIDLLNEMSGPPSPVLTPDVDPRATVN
jgi:hypothetical protein